MEILEKAPAKINLGLDTQFLRPDGYHELSMVMTTVDLADRVTLKEIPENKIIVTSNNAFLPLNKKNHAYQVAHFLKNKYHKETGLHIAIEKNIPIAAGLGGGSTDAAATLRGLNRLWDLQLSKADLAEIGLIAGSDVPFCVHGKTAQVTGFGEIITPLKELPKMWVVLVKPPVSVSTAKIFQALDVSKVTHPNINALVAAVNAQDYSGIIENLGNSLTSVTKERYPIVEKIETKMKQFGADGVLMTGSGPTVYGLCQNYSRAKRVYNSMKGFCHEVYLVRTL